MKPPIYAVLDKTGSTNFPKNDTSSDFGVGVVIFDDSQAKSLIEASKKIGEITGSTDYKYKHVQRNAGARQVYLSTVNNLKSPCGVFGFYAAGGSLLNEKVEAVKEMGFLGSSDGGYTAELAESLRQNEKGVHLEDFFGKTVSCLVWYSHALQRPLHLFLDDRTDLKAILEMTQKWLATMSELRHDISDWAKLARIEPASGSYNGIARFAGALAGDVRFFFNRHGEKIWRRLRENVRLTAADRQRILDGDESAFIIARVEEVLADENFTTGSKETCMIQGYTKRFIASRMTFASAQGKLGHLIIVRGNQWMISQIPD